jgi:hypothetical protein
MNDDIELTGAGSDLVPLREIDRPDPVRLY